MHVSFNCEFAHCFVHSAFLIWPSTLTVDANPTKIPNNTIKITGSVTSIFTHLAHLVQSHITMMPTGYAKMRSTNVSMLAVLSEDCVFSTIMNRLFQ